MAQAQTGQDHQGESPTPNAESPQDDSVLTQPDASGEQTSPANESDATSPPEVNGSTTDDRPRDPLGRFAPKEAESKPDPVAEAVARLSKPETATTPPAAKPEQPAKAAPEEKAKAPPTKDASTTSTTVDDLDVPEAEKGQWKRHTRERFDKVLTTLRSEREARKADEPILTHGREFSSLLNDFNLKEDIGFVPKEHIAGLISVQACVNRGLLAIQQGRVPAQQDRAALETFGQAVDSLRNQFGVQTAPSQAPAAPFTGELPADLKDLVDVYGIDEKRVRMLAAIEAGAKAPAQPPVQAAPVQPQAPQAPALQVKPEGVDMDALYSRRLMGDIAQAGDQNPGQTLRVLLNHPATKNEVIRMFPGTTPADVPAVFNALDPRSRYEVLAAAHRVMTKPVQPRPSTPLPPPTTQRSVPVTPALRRPAPDANGDPVASAIAYMAGNNE